jgi:acyl phosphate:glycerol-3-phosphate acyltransferase
VTVAAAVAVVLTYLVSSISAPWLIARLYGTDLRTAGSRKLGGSNLMKTVGVVPGVIGGVLDGAKGFFAVFIAGSLGLPIDAQLACGIAAVVGQSWPIFHGFDGGRANATGWGFAIAADPVAAIIMFIPILAAIAGTVIAQPRPTRLIPLASLLSFGVFAAVIWEQEGTKPAVVAGLVLLALVVLRRLTAGLREDLATGAPIGRVLLNRAVFDRSELQERGLVEI